MSLLDTKPASSHTILLTMTYGASPTIKRYCRWTSDITIGSETFISLPTLEVDLGKQDGGTKDYPTKIRMSASLPPMDRLVHPFAHAPVTVEVAEINPYDITSRNTLYRGTVGVVRKNPNGRKGDICELECFGIKRRLKDLTLSLPMLSRCDNRFRGPFCGVDASAWDRTGVVTSVGTPSRNSIVLNIAGVTVPATELPNERYQNGAVEVDGLSIVIRRSLGDRSFELSHIPPPWWEGATCNLFPGCSRLLKACRVWGQEEDFNGRGFKIPSRNPVFELPQ